MWGCVWSLLCGVVSAIPSFAIILLRKRELVALLYLCSCCRVVVCIVSLFLVVPWSLVFPGRTHLSERVVKNRKIIVSLPSIGSLLSYSVYRNLFRKVHLQAFSDNDRHSAIHFGVVSKAKREISIA